MDIESVINKVEITLILSFSELDSWFDKSEDLRSFNPVNGWSINLILEHIAITNHYLLLVIDKGSKRALSTRAPEMDQALKDYVFQWDALNAIGSKPSFTGEGPHAHEPRGGVDMDEVRSLLRYQLRRCIAILRILSRGEGILQRSIIGVNNVKEGDIYEHLYFLSQHIRRHLIQMEQIEDAFEEAVKFSRARAVSSSV